MLLVKVAVRSTNISPIDLALCSFATKALNFVFSLLSVYYLSHTIVSDARFLARILLLCLFKQNIIY